LSDRICPICNTSVPVTTKALPHDHDDAQGVRRTHKDFEVMVQHHFAKDPGLMRCEGSGAIFEME
jgi:hypothetical protein